MKRYSIRVPSEYQELAYISNSGTQYIDIGLKGSDLADCELEIVMRNDTTGTTSYNFNGTYLYGSTAQFGLVATSSSECRSSMNFGFVDAISTTGLNISEFHTIYATSGLQKVDNTVVGSLNFGTLNDGKFLLFARTEPNAVSGVNICAAMSLKSFTVKRNGQYIRNMIPVRRKSDSQLGLYDMANNVFYTNQGTGVFIAGADSNNWQVKNPPRYGTDTDIITDLPQEIITDGQPIGANLFDATGANVGYYIDSYGQLAGGTSAAGWTASDYIEIDENSQYTFTPNSTAGNSARHCFYNENKSAFISAIINSGQQTFITPVGAKYARFSYRDSSANIMLNSGSTALPYQPYAPTIIKGNMVQTGTPTPTTPIQPSETGERTGNLFDKNANIVWHNNATLNDSGNETSSNSSGYTNPFIEVESNTTYALGGELSQYGTGTSGGYRVYYYQDDTFISRSSVMNNYNKTFTTPQNCNKIALQCQIINGYPHLDTVMLNTGSTALPYEPYGYKIPILSGEITTHIYLGQVQSTRKIGKYEFTGQENWIRTNAGYFYTGNAFSDYNNTNTLYRKLSSMFSHYIATINDTNGNNLSDGYACLYCSSGNPNNYHEVYIRDNNYSTADDFKSYLAQQYANGTPVTIWYVLANETMGIVNEPIRKIGNYVDSISITGIPTTSGKQTFDIDTILKPSEVDLTYHGWHDASVREAVRTTNIYDKYNTIDIPDFGVRYGMYCELGYYSIYNDTDNNVYWFDNDGRARFLACSPHSTSTVSVSGEGLTGFYMPYNDGSLGEITIVKGTTVPDHYIPYIDWVDG